MKRTLETISHAQVPSLDSTHKNGATRVQSITLLSQPFSSNLFTELTAVLGPYSSSPLDMPASTNASAAEYPPRHRQLVIDPPNGGRPIQLLVKEARTPEETKWAQEAGEGIYSVTLETDSKPVAEQPIGAGVLVELAAA